MERAARNTSSTLVPVQLTQKAELLPKSNHARSGLLCALRLLSQRKAPGSLRKGRSHHRMDQGQSSGLLSTLQVSTHCARTGACLRNLPRHQRSSGRPSMQGLP